MYGISIVEYNILLEKQNNVCAICFLTDTDRRMAVDHNHQTGKLRGLLCQKCNKGLGLFNDNIELLKNTINYLSR